MANMPKPVPGVRDLHGLLIYLERSKERDKWLADAKKVLDANLKAVRLLGAEDEIQRNIDKSDRLKAKADRALEDARAVAESITDDAEDRFSKREGDLVKNEAAFTERMKKENDALRERTSLVEGKESEQHVGQIAAQQAFDVLNEDIAKREKSIKGRESRADNLMTAAKTMKAEAMALTENMKKVLA